MFRHYRRSMSSSYAMILAGGSGTRFWPLSRNAKPKQLLNLFGADTLLSQTLARLEGLIPRENILILTNSLQEDAVRQLASSLPPENIFAEPARRDTGPAVALGIGLVAARDPEASMLILPSDQLIQDTTAFQSVMSDALAAASESEGLITVGIKPTWACPSYGYVERGGAADLGGLKLAHRPHEVVRFREKPAPEQAEEFLASGNFAWNAGMFIWAIPTVLNELHNHAPELGSFVEEIRDSSDAAGTVATRFPELASISIDYALMEKASRVLNIEASFDWDDVGSWISVARHLETVSDSNQCNTPVTVVDSSNNIVFSEQNRRIALLGVEDLIVVQTDDAILVANRHRADEIRKIVQELPDELL
jgi:mannose-1-phosphate guanylyltransferase